MLLKKLNIFRNSSFYNLVLIGLLSFWHPVYISLTDIRVNSKTGDAEMSCRLFKDDLEEALFQQDKILYDLEKNIGNLESIQQRIYSYVLSNIQVKEQNEAFIWKPVGCEIKEESVWVYFESHKRIKTNSFSVYNNLLYSSFPRQSNMIHFYLNGARKSIKLDNPNSKTNFDW
jgi:hypothetical protein